MRAPIKILAALALLFGPACSRADPVAAPPSQNVSGTIAAGGSFQQVAPSAPGTRKGCTIQNPTTASEVLLVFFGPAANATTSNAYSLAAGAAISCAIGPVVVSDAIQVEAATTTHAFVAAVQ